MPPTARELEVAQRVFSSRLPVAERYAELLATDGIVRGLIGPRETSRLWERHLLNCAAVADLIPAEATVADLGSGAGLPGLVLAIRRPDLTVTLVEPLLRRTVFLTEVVAELSLTNVEVVRGRAEELAGVRDFEVVTSRALAPLPRLLGWSLPLVTPGGVVLAMKGSTAEQEVLEFAAETAALGGENATVIEVGEGVSTATVVRVDRGPAPRVVSSEMAATPRRRRPRRPPPSTSRSRRS